MKRIICAVLFVFTLVSCAPMNYGVLDYQKNFSQATCKVDGKYDVNIIYNEGIRTVEVISPENISGIKFVFDATSANAIISDISVPIETKYLTGINALSRMFSLDENKSFPCDRENTLSFDMDGTVYTLSFDENSLPKHIDISSENFGYSVDITSIKKNQTD